MNNMGVNDYLLLDINYDIILCIKILLRVV